MLWWRPGNGGGLPSSTLTPLDCARSKPFALSRKYHRKSPRASHYLVRSLVLMDWKHVGACRDLANDLFFDPSREDLAKQICKTCFVRRACLTYAVERKEKGVWGGTNFDERLQLREANHLDDPAIKITER